ncbi:insulinase family protein [Holzapfeliella sp. He02]|uniref:Insulinase family protein n=1 Tax=Holzapfeliella saturejae TaxID=3082953 RepID=A0ABU8SFM9_9LACO
MTTATILKNDNFKTVSIGCFFKLPLTKENLSYLTLLSNYQQLGTQEYDTQQKLEAHADYLYAAKFETRPQIYGNTIIVRAEGNFIEPDLVDDETYNYETIVRFFEEMVFNPNFKNQPEHQLQLAKKQVKHDYESFNEVASNKAYQVFFKAFYQDYPDFQNPIFGDLELVSRLSVSDLKNYYQDLVQAPATVIAYAKDPEKMTSILQSTAFDKLNTSGFGQDNLKTKSGQIDTRLEFDYGYNQTQLVYGYQTQEDYQTPILGLVFSQILGGDEYSLLFQEVRQKAGLVYSVFSDYYFYNNLVMIQTSLLSDSVTQASEIIEEQIQKVSDGAWQEDLLQTAKQQLISHRLILQEMPQFKVQSELIAQLRKMKQSDFAKQVNSVTKQQVVDFAKQLTRPMKVIIK